MSGSEAGDEPFELSVKSLQGKWTCDELNVMLTVNGRVVTYESGETYKLETTPDGTIVLFGYKALASKSDATAICWKQMETGERLTWSFEGEAGAVDSEPEVNVENIITDRKRRRHNVDYVALDKEIERGGNSTGKQSTWSEQYNEMKAARNGGRAESQAKSAEEQFVALKAAFMTWIASTNSDKHDLAIQRKGRLIFRHPLERSISNDARSRFGSFVQSFGGQFRIKKEDNGDQFIVAMVQEAAWRDLTKRKEPAKVGPTAETKSNDPMSVCSEISQQLSSELSDDSVLKNLKALDQVEMTLDILRQTKIGIPVNRLSKHSSAAIASAATKLVEAWKVIYTQSKQKSDG